MILRKMIIVLLALVFMTFQSFAKQSCEIDTVGCDASNFFLGPTGQAIIANNINSFDVAINFWSNFAYDEEDDWGEYFETNAGQLRPDPCFSTRGRQYNSALSDVYNSSYYEWNIVLQMKPEYDLNLKIIDCVLHGNESDPYSKAAQTGYFRDPETNELSFDFETSPLLTVTAHPGPFAKEGFDNLFHLDARMLPSLELVLLNGIAYASKGIFAESILVKLPVTGEFNVLEEPMFTLKQGDQIRVRIEVPEGNLVDIRYGQDNVILEYIGVRHTGYLTDGLPCRWRWGGIRPIPIIPIRPGKPIWPPGKPIWPKSDSNGR